MTNTDPHRDRLLTRREAAELLGIQPQTLATWASTGRYEIPYLKVGRAVRYRESAIETWLRRREKGGATEPDQK